MQRDYEELFESIPCGILQLELPFGNTCQIYRVNPRAEQIMKVHLEEGEQKITLVNPAAWQLLGFEREEQCLHKSLNDDRNECEFRAADGKGGLGMNEEGEVVIFDGVHTLYAVPFLSLSETYEKGKEFLNGENLTQEQKIAYHCD